VETFDQRVQGGQVVGLDLVHSSGEGLGVLVSHHRGEVDGRRAPAPVNHFHKL
jgi:hypothetical protein